MLQYPTLLFFLTSLSLVSSYNYTAYPHTIGPQAEQKNASVPGGSLFNCKPGLTPIACITFAENLCSARDWCNSFAILDLYELLQDTGHKIQLYRAGVADALTGHPRWTLFDNGKTPPPPPGPSTPNRPSVKYCSTKKLAHEMSEILFRNALPGSATEFASHSVSDALQMREQCNETASDRPAEARIVGSHVDSYYRSQLDLRAKQFGSSNVGMQPVVVDCSNGNDTNDGLSAETALRTLQAALKKLSSSSATQMNGKPSVATEVVIHVRNTCYLEETLVLDNVSLPSSATGVIITSYPGDRVALSGGQFVTNIEWVTPPSFLQAPDGVMMAKITPQNANFSSVFFLQENSRFGEGSNERREWRRAVRSRHPDGNPEINGLWTPHEPGARVGYYPPAVSDSLGSFSQSCKAIPSTTLCNRSVPRFVYGTFTGGYDQTAGYTPSFEAYWCGKWKGCKGIDYTKATKLLPHNGSVPPLPDLPTETNSARRIVIHSTRGDSDIWANFQWAVSYHDAKNKHLQFSTGGYQFPRGTGDMGWWFVDNAGINSLSMPLEWWYSQDTATLYMMKNSSSALPTSLVIGHLKTLIRASGSQEHPLVPITIENITIAHSEVTFLEPYETPSGGGYSVARRAAIEIEGVQSPAVRNCTLRDIGGNGVLLSNWNRGAIIAENEITRVGDSGVVLLGTTHFCNASGGNQPRGTLVHANVIHEVGLFGKQGTGIFQALSMQTTVTGNAIFNGPRSGILFNDGMGGAHRVESNLLFNLCRETTDHGPFNSWDRTPYVIENNGALGGIGPALTNMTRNMVICNYQCTWPIDHDDGSNTYNDTFNVLFYGGAKNFLGHDKHSIANLYIDVDNKPQEGGDIGQHLPFCATNDHAVVDSSGYGEVYANNACILAGTLPSVEPYKYNYCAVNKTTGRIVSGTIDMSYGNSFFLKPNSSILVTCSASGDHDPFTLKGFQEQGYDIGSTTRTIPSESEILSWARSLLFPVEPDDLSDDPRDLPWARY